MNDRRKEFNYDAAWTKKLESKEHWLLYWKQQWLLTKYLRQEDTILEIGLGSGFTANYLRNKNYTVTTLDIDNEKKPDIVANIVDYELKSNYDIILAFEVFEHFHFNYLKTVLQMLHSHCNRYLLISIPEYLSCFFSLEFKLFWVKKTFSVRRPSFYKLKKISQNHHWEVNSNPETKLNKLMELFHDHGFKIMEQSYYQDRHFIALERIP